METTWTRSEFKGYLLSYAARANYFESEEEKEMIEKMVSHEDYVKIHRELAKDNDYQSIQKIVHTLERFNYSKDELEQLVRDINSLFNADGIHDVLEDNMLLVLKKFLK
mgnify:CR=1 FL=1